MYSPRVKQGIFILEGTNALATAWYFNYMFFFLQATHGFGTAQNLRVCALSGFAYMAAAFFSGRFAQRQGYFLALKLGFGLMLGALVLGHASGSAFVHVGLMVVWSVGMAFTWPALEALVSEGEPPRRLQRMLGIYNVTWATGGAVAFFTGGALYERLGSHALFTLPAAVHLGQLLLTQWLQQRAQRGTFQPPPEPRLDHSERRRSPVRPQRFLLMAWVANPFAYIAMNSLIPVFPDLARHLGLSPTAAGVFCSVWFFARALSFLGFWLWTGWHYRFRWLGAAFLLMLASYVAILLVPGLADLTAGVKLAVVVVAQLLFGVGVGQIYYSSLFYSMDVGDTKGEHGGLHEAAIGAGIFAGPAIGAVALSVAPGRPDSGTWAVAFVLLAGFTALQGLRWVRSAPRSPRAPGA